MKKITLFILLAAASTFSAACGVPGRADPTASAETLEFQQSQKPPRLPAPRPPRSSPSPARRRPHAP